PAGLLDSAARPWLGQRIPISTLCEVRDRAAAILRTKGYLAAVRLPPQTIDGGTVRFDVLLARITGFQVRGNAGRAEGLIAGYLEAIRSQPVFNLLEAERYLLLARDIPGHDVRMTLRPAGTGQGEVIGEGMVTHTPVMVEANVQNYGSQATGRIGGLVQARLNGVILPGDQTRIAYYGTADFKEQHVLQVGEQVRIGREGLTVSADFVHAWTRPAIAPGLDLRSKTWVATLAARYPLVRRQARNLALGGGFEAVNQDIPVGGLPLSMDKLRVGFVRADFDAVDPASLTSASGFTFAEPRWRLNGSAELRQGLSVLGASEDCGPGLARCRLPGVVPPSRLEADPTAFVARAQVTGEVRLLPVLGFQLSARGQKAAAQLRGVLRGQFHGRTRLRSGHHRGRQRPGAERRAALRTAGSRQRPGHCLAGLWLRRSGLGVESRFRPRHRLPRAAHFGRRRPAAGLGRPDAARCRGRRAACPHRRTGKTRRCARAAQPDCQARPLGPALGVRTMTSAKPLPVTSTSALALAAALAAGVAAPQTAQAQAIQGTFSADPSRAVFSTTMVD
ncbi:MAG TPA: POTRA domain-containing protein, partial [Novosphingobium sp.]|nr:POTRA domain-containing protein [Novosphingobium sp.]